MSDKYAALKARIEKALEDFTNGRASMHVPVLDTDVDLVLYDCLELLAERDADKRRIEELEAANALNKHLELAIRKAEGCSEALRRRAETAEQRIAELEAQTPTVKLPQRYSMLHRSDFDEPYHTEMVYKQHEVLEALAAAGISLKIEGE